MIKGFFDPATPRPTPKVRVALLLPDIGRRSHFVDFQIDTGTDESILHPTDAVQIGLDLSQLLTAQPSWGSSHELIGIGGRMISYRVRAAYLFQHESRTQRVDGLIHIARWTPESSALPSLLGWDVLRYFRLMMHWSTRVITLHEHDSELFG